MTIINRFANIFLWFSSALGIIFILFINNLTLGAQSINTKMNGFRTIEIPSVLVTTEARTNYLATHYWDLFNFSDTTYIHSPEIIEQAFVNYLKLLHTKDQIALTSMESMLNKSIEQDKSGKMYAYFLLNYKKYLYDPNSPLLNEEYYIPITNYILTDTVSDKTTKERAGFDLTMMLKNRKGTQASNFKYMQADGKTSELYKLKKDYTLLYFYNPECDACEKTSDYLKQSSLINHLLNKNIIDILAVYPDENIDAWKLHKTEIPSTWINARNMSQEIANKQLYILRAIPTFYLMDRQKRILLKDADVISIEKYLHNMAN